MTQDQLKAKIKSSDLGGSYILCGDEDYLKRHYLSQIRKTVLTDEAFSFFNHICFEGAEVDFAEISEAIKSPPMMADFKLIEWKYPDFEKMTSKDLDAMAQLADLAKEHPFAIVVFFPSAEGFDPGTERRPSKLKEKLAENYNVINFEKSTDGQLIPWLRRHFDSEGIGATNETLAALIFRSGHSMDVLSQEVKKLSAYAKANDIDKITESDVQLVASSTIECDAFALSTAITGKNRNGAFFALNDMKERRLAPPVILASLARSFSELVTVSILLEEGKGADDITSILKWKPTKTKYAVSAATRWGKNKLTSALAKLRRLDSNSKSGGAAGLAPIEIFISRYL